MHSELVDSPRFELVHADILVPPQCEWPVHPAKARRAGPRHLRVLRAEEGVSFVNRLQDRNGAFGIRGRAAELLELLVRPIHQQHLPIKFVASRRYDAIEFVNSAIRTKNTLALRVSSGQRIEGIAGLRRATGASLRGGENAVDSPDVPALRVVQFFARNIIDDAPAAPPQPSNVLVDSYPAQNHWPARRGVLISETQFAPPSR